MSWTNIPLYIPKVPSIPASFSQLLTTYSNIPSESQKDHIQQIRDLAYIEHQYPCLGRFRFLDLDMSAHPIYGHLVSLFRESLLTKDAVDDEDIGTREDAVLKRGPIFLDIGCCVAQDLRKLVFDITSASASAALTDHNDNNPDYKAITPHLFASDIVPAFIDLSYTLFNDEAIIPRTQFLSPANIFDSSETNPLRKLDGKVSVLHVGAVFHLFGLEQQQDVGRGCLRLLRKQGVASTSTTNAAADGKPEEKVSWDRTALILGEQIGNIAATEVSRLSGGSRFRHNADSWREMWERLVEEDEWKGLVKGVRVESRMEGRSEASKGRDLLEKEIQKGGGGEDEKEKERKKFIGKVEEGFRWQLWWVWVDFV